MFRRRTEAAFHLAESPSARESAAGILLITAHATLAHTTLGGRWAARLGERRASCSDQTTTSSWSHGRCRRACEKQSIRRYN
jgi:hypothetical protein